MKDKGVGTVIITMGAQGALLLYNDFCTIIPTAEVIGYKARGAVICTI